MHHAPRHHPVLCLLTTPPAPPAGKSEYVQGLTVEECATLLNIDVEDHNLMDMLYDTAFAIKNRIYGNRIVLFAPLYIANYCVNNCTYCAFRSGNKSLQVSPAARPCHALRRAHHCCACVCRAKDEVRAKDERMNG